MPASRQNYNESPGGGGSGRPDMNTGFSYFQQTEFSRMGTPTGGALLSPAMGSDIDPLSPEASDRVFPIRSVFGVDSSQQLSRKESSIGGGSERGRNESLRDARLQSNNDASSVRSESITPGATRSVGCSESTLDESLFTQRFRYKATEEGHMVVTGNVGYEKMQKCEDEPIHAPGAVQSFGALVVLRLDPDDENILVVRIASENTGTIIGYSPQQLFALPSITEILSDEQSENLLDHIDFMKDDNVDVNQAGPEVFCLIITGPDALQIKLWCAIHLDKHDRSLVICEFELEDDAINPIAAQDEITPAPEDTLNSEPTEEELSESTVTMSKPLRLLRHARRRKGEAAAMEVFSIMSQIQEQLSSATNLQGFLKILVGVIKELSGFHRVMIYQFDEQWNGRVVTELVDYRTTRDLYKGLNFPASDIPAQARELYKISKVRLLYDRDQETARLVCRGTEDLEQPLDMTHCYLRAMSPIHVKYLANMAVRASMSISITAFQELWGLISCHSYGQRGMRVSFPIRKLCRLIGETASRNIERLSYASRLQARKLINTVPTEANPSGYIVASSDDLLQLFDADFGLLSIRDETKILGQLENTQEALVLLEYFRMRGFTNVVPSVNLSETFPDLRYGPGFKAISGALVVPLSSGGKDFIVFFRKGQLKQVHWAGNPYEKTLKEGTSAYLEPRKSFKIWSETVVGRSKEWTEEEVETAAVLCLVYGKFIEVWRQKEAALQSSQLTRILLANASHEVRTPLNAIINYLEIALESPLDSDTRESLSKSHSASKSLIYVINDLLDLTRTEEGHDLIKEEMFDLPMTIREATGMFTADAARKGLTFDVIEYPGVPRFVKGDQSKVRQAVANISANAVSHTESGGIQVELWLSASFEDRCEIEIAVQDTGSGMSSRKLDALFRELEQVQTDPTNGLGDVGESQSLMGNVQGNDNKEKTTLGLGLAVVARIIKNMNGQLRLKSEEGKGSRFTIQMTFALPVSDNALTDPNRKCIQTPNSEGTQTPHPSASSQASHEVTLVRKDKDNVAAHQPEKPSLSRRTSNDSVGSSSVKSGRSGASHKSEVDRLIDAISSNTGLASPAVEDGKRMTGVRQKEPRKASSVGRRSVNGRESVQDSSTPIKSVKMPDDGYVPGLDNFEQVQLQSGSQPSDSPSSKSKRHSIDSEDSVSVCNQHQNMQHAALGSVASIFSVLVAEDDPINSKIIKKRLEKMGHGTSMTLNGEQCVTMFKERSQDFDVVLMDIQMPIMDGYTATQKIRKLEAEDPALVPYRPTQPNKRTPIFAVSASLIEEQRQRYIDYGFDGWILKPIDFKRLAVLMDGIINHETRVSVQYKQGSWEHGGWFHADGIKDD